MKEIPAGIGATWIFHLFSLFRLIPAWPVCNLLSVGLASLNLNSNPFHYVKSRQSPLVGLVGLITVISIDYRVWRRWTKVGYLYVLLLGATLVAGKISQGSQRWFSLGGFNLQPSEIAKIVIIVVLAHYLEKPGSIQGKKIIIPFLLIAVPMALIILQPDLGTSIVFVGIVFAMTYTAGGNVRHLGIIALVGSAVALAAILLSYYGVVVLLEDYQLRRLLVFLDPYSDPTGSGWNVIQSMIAIGSGGFLGKGYLNGTQSQLLFLPANHTDFIFSVAAEEFGFVGASAILLTYAFLIWRGIKIAMLAKDRFGSLLAVGCVGYFSCHLIINVGMTVGIMPVTGLPLPFLTYGGSTLLTSLLAVGILLNVGLRRQKIMF